MGEVLNCKNGFGDNFGQPQFVNEQAVQKLLTNMAQSRLDEWVKSKELKESNWRQLFMSVLGQQANEDKTLRCYHGI